MIYIRNIILFLSLISINLFAAADNRTQNLTTKDIDKCFQKLHKKIYKMGSIDFDDVTKIWPRKSFQSIRKLTKRTLTKKDDLKLKEIESSLRNLERNIHIKDFMDQSNILLLLFKLDQIANSYKNPLTIDKIANLRKELVAYIKHFNDDIQNNSTLQDFERSKIIIKSTQSNLGPNSCHNNEQPLGTRNFFKNLFHSRKYKYVDRHNQNEISSISKLNNLKENIKLKFDSLFRNTRISEEDKNKNLDDLFNFPTQGNVYPFMPILFSLLNLEAEKNSSCLKVLKHHNFVHYSNKTDKREDINLSRTSFYFLKNGVETRRSFVLYPAGPLAINESISKHIDKHYPIYSDRSFYIDKESGEKKFIYRFKNAKRLKSIHSILKSLRLK